MIEVLEKIEELEEQVKKLKNLVADNKKYKAPVPVEYFSLKDLSTYLNLSEHVIQTLKKNHLLPYVQLNQKNCIYIKKDIDEWVSKCKGRLSIEEVKRRIG